MHDKPILIGYDGSDAAKRAIGFAGRYFAGRRAVVATALEDASIDETQRTNAGATAEEGAALARDVGLDAEARPMYAAAKPWQALIALADEIDAGLIVVGSHGFNGRRPLVLGSVSHQLGHLAHQPVVAVPTPEAIAARRERQSQNGTHEHAHH